MIEIPSYPKIWGLGHGATGVLKGQVQIEEKVDGSQFSFMLNEQGELFMRSKGQSIYVTEDGQASEKMFNKAVETVLGIREAGLLTPGYIYRCEYLQKPKHNALTYARVPKGHLMVYDIGVGMTETYLPFAGRRCEAERIGLEVVPTLRNCDFADIDQQELLSLLDRESFLGGTKIEGIVLKFYDTYMKDGKTAMVKFVSEKFKELNHTNWKSTNPGSNDIVASLTATLRNERRWEKGFEYLRDCGAIKYESSDIGSIMARVKEDITEECEAEIKDRLYKWAMPKILRGATAGLPEWYKQKLLQLALLVDVING